KPFPRRRLGLTAAAGLVLAAVLLWVAPFSSRPQATRSDPAVRTHARREAPESTSVPLLVAPRPQQPEPAPPARAESTPDSAVGPEPGEGHIRLGPLESPESQPLETPPAIPRDTGRTSCDKLKTEIQAKLDAKRVTGY